MNKAAFTMIELILAIVILAVIASIGTGIIANLYKSKILAQTTSQLQEELDIAVSRLEALLEERIKPSVRVRFCSNELFKKEQLGAWQRNGQYLRDRGADGGVRFSYQLAKTPNTGPTTDACLNSEAQKRCTENNRNDLCKAEVFEWVSQEPKLRQDGYSGIVGGIRQVPVTGADRRGWRLYDFEKDMTISEFKNSTCDSENMALYFVGTGYSPFFIEDELLRAQYREKGSRNCTENSGCTAGKNTSSFFYIRTKKSSFTSITKEYDLACSGYRLEQQGNKLLLINNYAPWQWPSEAGAKRNTKAGVNSDHKKSERKLTLANNLHSFKIWNESADFLEFELCIFSDQIAGKGERAHQEGEGAKAKSYFTLCKRGFAS